MATGEERADRRFENIFGRVGKLEEKTAEFCQWKERVDMDLYNHGKEGMKTILTQFITESRTREEEREKQLQERERQRLEALSQSERHRDRQIAVLGVIVAFMTALVAWMAYVNTAAHVKAGDLSIPFVSHSEPMQPFDALAKPIPQDAAIPLHP